MTPLVWQRYVSEQRVLHVIETASFALWKVMLCQIYVTLQRNFGRKCTSTPAK